MKWIEDRLEHLAAASSAPNRVTRIQAAYDDDGVVERAAADPLGRPRRLPARADAGADLSHARPFDERLRASGTSTSSTTFW